MKKYKVIATYLSWCETEIEAENEEQAWEIALDTDGAEFEPVGGRFQELSDWHIEDVSEVNA
jgi:hypothetical protein